LDANRTAAKILDERDSSANRPGGGAGRPL